MGKIIIRPTDRDDLRHLKALSHLQHLLCKITPVEVGFDAKEQDEIARGDKKFVKEIPRSQRYVSRPSLGKIFGGKETRIQRDVGICVAHLNHGYTLKEIADYLHVHYTTVSKVISKAGKRKK